MRSCHTIVELLLHQAAQRPDLPAYTFLADGEAEAARLTFAELDRVARGIGAALTEAGAAGERALLLYPPGLEFVGAFLGSLYAGALAVPAYPPRSARGLPRLRAIAQDAQPRVVLTTAALLGRTRVLLGEMPELAGAVWLATDGLEARAAEWREPAIDGETLAFLQYTSGSTATPKGVMVSHANLLHNEEMIRRAFAQSEESVILGWLPLYHDMGLIGNVLQPLYVGAPCILMSPVAFLQNPLRWLSAISRYRATTSGGPNFAYELCVRRIAEEQKAGLDLSSWRVAFNGAEPVRAGTLDRFAGAFASCGFRREAFYPCYGLAEATLFVTGGLPEAAPVVGHFATAEGAPARPLVSSGRPWVEQRVAIVDPESGEEVVEAGRVGEVWVMGPSVARGYWRRPELTERDFRACLPDGAGPFLRTGDLGFVADGELYITGRLKDLIILRGRNHYPQDIELTAERAHPLLRPGCGAAFSVEEGGEERLVLVHEVERRSDEGDPSEVAEAVRAAVAAEHEVQVWDVVLIRTGTLPKTSSGKVQRHACRAAWQSGELNVVASRRLDLAPEAAPAGDAAELSRGALLALDVSESRPLLEAWLRERVARVLRTAPGRIGPDTPLAALGLDSLSAVELKQEVERELGVPVPLGSLLEGATAAELAGELLDGLSTEGAEPDRIVPGDPGETEGDLPLSHGQRALWFLQEMAPASAALNIAAAVEVRGDLDAAALGRAFQALADRHPALRTAYHAAPGGPVQRVHPPGREIDFRIEEASGDLLDRLRAEVYRPFDLAAGPLLRVALFRQASGVHVLGLAVHHIAADFWSLAVMCDELGRLYAAETGGEKMELAPLPVAYADWVRWQNARLAGPEGERLGEWWREALGGPLPDLDLPTDRPRPAVQTDRGATRGKVLGPETAAALQALARSSGATLFATLLAGFQALLHRYSGQEGFAVGCPVAGRNAPELAGLVGYFVNPVVVRGDLSGAPTGAGLLARARRSALAALEHAEYPFALLTERLRPVRDPSRSPLFQAMLVLQTHRPEQRDLAGLALGEAGSGLRLGPLELRSIPLGEKPAQLDVALSAAAGDAGLALSLHVNTDLFDPDSAERMLEHLATLLEALAAEPGLPVAELPLLTPAERAQMLVAWNDTAAETPSALVHELFALQAERMPERPALVGDTALTYGELARRAGELAAHLRRLGVGPEVPVGVCLDRTPGMVVGVLGVLAAGGAYVPLDPSYPQERIAYMLEDSGAPVVITEEGLRPVLGGWTGRLVRLDEDEEEIRQAGAHPLRGGADPDNPAYLIYTSGSTGRPKGVQVPHRGVVNFLASMARQPGLGPDDVLVSVTTLSFDIAGLELYLPLSVGARLILASRETAADGVALLRLLRSTGATVMQATPSTWRLLLAAGWDGTPRLRALCGGEALPRELADAVAERADGLWNLYGPTETTIWSAVHRVEKGPGPVLIGRPIANTGLFLVDPAFQPVPVGVPGELWIGGAGVTRGYFRRPDLTAERFVPDPWSGEPGARLYRTGDLARYRPGGDIEILGRLDHQVKVRGFRIELGEVEMALAQHPAVRQAVVAAREDRLVAYLVPIEGAAALDAASLRGFLAERLPAPFVPSVFVSLDRFPLTPNGKVDRKALPAPEAARREPVEAQEAPRSDLERALAALWREVLGVEAVGLHENFFDLGGHSLLVAEVHRRLREEMGIEISMVELFRSPTVAALAARLSPEGAAAPKPAARREPAPGRSDVAIIGMAGRFPGAGSVDELWPRLRAGEELITFFTEDELRREGVDPTLLADPAYVRAAGVVEEAEMFDAAFFGFTPREAELMDPQHRVFLEHAWQALEDAGYDSERTEARIGVYAGVGINTYLLHTGLGTARSLAGRYQAFIGNDKDFVPTRVSYKLNLRGPSINVQTACSTSLVALHLACQALAAGDCDMALAGGVSIRTPQKEGYLWEEGGIPSPDGHCRAFDARAQGTVFGNGVGLVVLKRLDRALADGDRVRAVVKGSAINNDGSGKIGYTAPSVDGQARVVAEALAAAGVEPETVSYIEAHGTGTPLGDPIEVAALAEVFGSRPDRRGACAIGSVKSNLGHLDTAAGVAGLIKTVLALEHGEIPPSLHYEAPNPRIDFDSSPFRVHAALTPWIADGAPRRAGVSSFGIGGTNAHVVLEEAPPAEPSGPSREWQLLVLSARTPTALDAATARLAAHLREHPELPLPDVAHTLRLGRRAFPWRRTLVCREASEAAEALAAVDPERVATGTAEAGERSGHSVAFLFSGQGAQHAGMARGLYDSEPVFRREMDRCAEILGRDPLADPDLERTELAQPALFAVEYSLARLWMEWGVRPDAMLGHSVGEYVAACLAGVFSLEGALALVAARGRLMGSMPPGSMLGIDLPEAEVLPLLGDGLSLAAVNAPASCVISGPTDTVAALERELEVRGARHRRLHTSHAFHSAMMDPILAPFAAEVARVGPQPPRARWISNVTGTWITPEQAVDPEYWSRHLRGTVRFADGVRELLAEPGRVLLEVGPGHTLATLARQQVPAGTPRTILSSIRHPRDPQPDEAVLLRALGRLWLAGVAVDWAAYGAGERRRRVPLPTYPFERQRYRLEPARRAEPAADPLRRKSDPAEWLWAPVWRQAVRPAPSPLDPASPWLLLGPGGELTARLARLLEARGVRVSTADPRTREDWDALFADPPRRIVHTWSLGPMRPEEAQQRSYDSVVALVQALERANVRPPEGEKIEIVLLSDGLHRVAGAGGLHPEKALLLGPLRVVPQELPHLACRAVDVILPEPGSPDLDDLAGDLLAQLSAPAAAGETVIAWRDGERWVRGLAPAPLADGDGPAPRLRPGGVYLITGGFGGIGLTLAGELARQGAKLALVGRHPRQVPELEALGAEVLALAADVTDEAALAAAVQAAEERFGPLHGVIHAAGVPGGRLLQLATPEGAAAVLAPKVQGTLALHRALGDRSLDFLLLCSSINSALGGVGQSDYCAANAFLDAFAQSVHRRAPRRGTYTVAVGWDRWEEVGMAARSSSPLALWRSAAPVHPLLGAPVVATPERRIFRSELRVETAWVLSEHRIAGRPTVPGTTYLEMARAALAALEEGVPGRPVEIREAVFLAPLALLEGEAREVLTVLEAQGEGFAFRILSRPAGDEGSPRWDEHARGHIAFAAGVAPEPQDLAILRALCSAGEITARRERRGDGPEFLVTGPRWQSLQRIHVGDGESLAELALDPAFAGDLASFALHPALLDVAAGAVQFLSDGDFLPLTYERLRVWAPLAARGASHFRLRGTPGEVLTCDITLLDESGAVLAEIEGFSMRRVGQALAAQLQAGRAEIRRVTLPELPAAGEAGGGIAPREGVEIFRRILRSGAAPMLWVSTRDLPAAVAQADAVTAERLAEDLASAPAATHARPEVSSAYAPPTDDVESRVAEVWQRVLGIRQVGIHDNFFELGGTSLSGVQLVSELKRELGTDIPTVSIFEAPTIASLARYLRPKPREASLAERSRSRAENKMRALAQVRRAAGQRRR